MDKEVKSLIKSQVRLAIESSQTDVEELVLLLEITVQDLIKKFPEKLIENAEKFGVYTEAEREEEGTWREEEI